MPLLTLPLIIGIFIGGNWMWFGIGLLFMVVIVGDTLLGDDDSQHHFRHPQLLEIPLHFALPLICLVLVSLMWSSGRGTFDLFNISNILNNYIDYNCVQHRNNNSWINYFGAILGVGFTVAGYGTNVAHELTHRVKNKLAMFEGRWLLSASCNADFAIEHVYGHHVTVGTEDDPATAHRGENVYLFSIKSTILGHISAWKLELKRISKKKIKPYSLKNRMITGYLMSFVWCGLFYYSCGIFGLLLFFSQAFFAKFILEIVNYMEHYGLIRKENQKVGYEHSWNTNKRMSSIVLFTLTRHSAHHEKPTVPFWKLDPYLQAPQMPSGYLTTLLICLIPPVWYKVINPKLDKWDRNYL